MTCIYHVYFSKNSRNHSVIVSKSFMEFVSLLNREVERFGPFELIYLVEIRR